MNLYLFGQEYKGYGHLEGSTAPPLQILVLGGLNRSLSCLRGLNSSLTTGQRAQQLPHYRVEGSTAPSLQSRGLNSSLTTGY